MERNEQMHYVDRLLSWSRELQKSVGTDLVDGNLQAKFLDLERGLSNIQRRTSFISSEELSNLAQKANQVYMELNHGQHVLGDEKFVNREVYSGVEQRKEAEVTRIPIGGHRLPPLPYAYNALLPYIDEEIMRLHHAQHHKTYVDGLNKAETEMEKARQSGDFNLIKHWEREAAFHGAGHYLHTIFWNVMSPKGGGEPKGALAEQINLDFGSFAKFKEHFSEAAKKVEAVGWAILV
ncbi:MAG: superoxide dismutase, partial [Anaerobacillus sp.]|uniref:superoxide dismutase n=1 Tax=Anaerobacillus sp. TaxID=1872506 RepID=UPI00391D7C36